MDDLISRRAVLDMWRQMICYDRTCHYRDEGRCTETFCDFKLFEYQINHMPSVNPQPCEDAISRQALLDDFGFSEKTRKWGGNHSGYNTMMLYEIQDIIESQPSVKPQESCEDAISRQAVHEAITRWAGSMSVLIALPTREVRPLLESIHKLPSVKPQENTGHWIGIDEEPHEVWECDHCGFVIDGSGCIDPYDYRDTYKYCPYCGARMVDEQESEVQDADSN